MRRGLLKVEQLHGLARAVYYGQRGRISAREVYDQMNACSCLILIFACIVYWQAREISRLAAASDFPFDPDLLRHFSPIEWKNVGLYGEIKIDPPSSRGDALSVYQNTNVVGPLFMKLRPKASAAHEASDVFRTPEPGGGSGALLGDMARGVLM